MALNKLIVFNMTEYRKLIFMDGDTLFCAWRSECRRRRRR